MLSTNKLRSIYSKIQTQIFYMIPEKWEKICLYALITEKVNNIQTGEMFFYYFPAGLLKKNPVNVYEIPAKFNIEEDEYMKLVDKLYNTIKELRETFKLSSEEKVWTNITITIENLKFNVEYNYEDLLGSKYSSEDRHIIWKCQHLGMPLERLSKRERKMVEEYIIEKQFENNETKTYTEGMYKNKVHNIVEYNGEYNIEIEQNNHINKNEEKAKKLKEKKIDKYELYKLKKQEEKDDKYEQYKEQKEERKKTMKNQILNF